MGLRNKVFVCAAFVAVAVASCFAPSVKAESADGARDVGVDFRSGSVKYVLDRPFNDMPQTFECSIKIDKTATGEIGNIFSNERRVLSPLLSYSVNENGNMVVEWNSYERVAVFDRTDLRTGDWEHVTVVRSKDKDGFEMYLNGEPVQTVACGVGSDVFRYYLPHCIGGDWNVQQSDKNPFDGKIRQITVYSAPLTAGEVKRDYHNGDKISAETRPDLMFHVNMYSPDVVFEDSSAYGNDACLGTNDYFFDGDVFETKDYTMAILPDMQCMTNHLQSALDTLSDYIVKNAAAQKTGVVITTGDITDGITNGKDWDRQYTKIKKVLDKVKTAAPYIAVPGNHDYDNECKTDHSVTHFDGAIPVSELSGWECWGGSFSASSAVNAYYLFEFCGVKYVIFALDFGPSDDVLEWCCDITERYPDRRVIAVTHGYLTGDGRPNSYGLDVAPTNYGWNGKTSVNNADGMWDKWLKKYPNIFMTISGHVTTEDILLYEQTGENGNVVAHFCINGQSLLMNNAVEAMLGLFNFDERNQLIYINYLSTIHDKLFNVQNQFVYSFKGNTQLVSPNYPDASAYAPTREQVLSRMNVKDIVPSGASVTARGENTDIKGTVIWIVVSALAVGAAVVYVRSKQGEK